MPASDAQTAQRRTRMPSRFAIPMIGTVLRPVARRRAFNSPFAAAALVLLTGACASQRESVSGLMPEPAAGEAVYDTQVLIRPEGAALEARTTLRYLADEKTAREVGLLLNRGLTVQGVRGAAVRSYRVAPFEQVPSWNVVTVELDGVKPGSPVGLDITYSGQPEFSSDKINGISSGWVELGLDSQWHPVVSTLDQQMTGTLRVDLPAGWMVVASGPTSLEDSVHVVRNTVPQVDVAFVAAPSFEQTSSDGATVYFRESGSETATAVLRAAESCGRSLDHHYGARDPLPESKLVLAERSGPGYARKNYIVLSEVNAEDPLALHRFLCHELAHYWTRSAGSFSPHHWMTEAFAEYAAAIVVRERFGKEAYDKQVAQWEGAGRASGPVWTPESTRRASGAAMYRRAPYLLHRLEGRIGTERFRQFLTRYMTEDVRTTPELLERLREVAGAETARWFREQLAGEPSGSAP